MSLAKAVLSGTVATPLEKRYTPNNTPIVSFDLSVPSPPRFNGQADEPFIVKVTCWNRLADSAAERLQPGDTLLVEGKLMCPLIQTPAGVQKKVFEIEAINISQVTGAVEPLILVGASAESSGAASRVAPRPAPVSAGVSAPSAATPSASAAGDVPSLSPEEALTEDDIPF